MRPHLNGKKLGMVGCTCHQLWWEASNRTIKVQAGQTNSETLISKINRAKRARGIAQAVEHLPRKCKALYDIFDIL
jgi:hypothetical protein